MMTAELAGLLDQIPDLDGDGRLTGPDPAAAEEIYRRILDGGRDYIVALVDAVEPAGPDADFKPAYVLHGLAVYVGRSGALTQRAGFAATLAAQLGGDRPKHVQRFVIRELQVAGGPEVVDALGALLLDEELCASAAQALVAIGDGAAERLRAALPRARGGVRVTLVQALGCLRDQDSVPVLIEAAGGSDGDVRLAAIDALAAIGDASAVEVLLRAADTANEYDRIQCTAACLTLAGKLTAAGKKEPARRIYTYLSETRTGDSEQHVRDAARRGLDAMQG